MPRSRAECARPPGHNPPCKTPVAVEADRRRAAERRAAGRKDDPEVKQRYNTAYRLVAYGLTPERFYVLLAGQGFACGMCHEKFADGQRVCVDHDHGCCKTEKRCCGKCVRGLLCVGCNVSLGHIERKGALARAYLVGVRGLEPRASSLSGTRSNRLSYTPSNEETLPEEERCRKRRPCTGYRRIPARPTYRPWSGRSRSPIRALPRTGRM